MTILEASTETHEQLRRLLENWEWLNNNLAGVQVDYGRKWVAITGRKIVAQGLTAAEVKTQIEGKYPRSETLLLSVPEGEVSRPM